MENGKKKQKVNIITWKGKRNDKRENNIKRKMIKLFNKKTLFDSIINHSQLYTEELFGDWGWRMPFLREKKTF